PWVWPGKPPDRTRQCAGRRAGAGPGHRRKRPPGRADRQEHRVASHRLGAGRHVRPPASADRAHFRVCRRQGRRHGLCRKTQARVAGQITATRSGHKIRRLSRAAARRPCAAAPFLYFFDPALIVMSVLIKEEDFIQSIADGIQFISYYHPVDYIRHLARAYEREESPAARDAMAQILTNSRMCAEGKRPLCQDTGIVNVFVKVGMDVRINTRCTLQERCDEGVRRGYTNSDNPLRASVLDDPIFARKNTRDNTPCILHVELVPGDKVDVQIASKGGGSENKSKFAMLNPSDSLVDWVLKTVPTMGAGWCPPGMLGIGVGGTAEKAMLMAKQSLMEDIDMYELLARGPQNKLEELRIELYEKVNALGIGAQGLGGLTTVLDVKINTFPTHAASKPVAMIPNCAATRHAHFVLDGSGVARLDPPSLSEWPEVHWAPDYNKSRQVNLDTLTPAEVASWKPGQTLLLSGK